MRRKPLSVKERAQRKAAVQARWAKWAPRAIPTAYAGAVALSYLLPKGGTLRKVGGVLARTHLLPKAPPAYLQKAWQQARPYSSVKKAYLGNFKSSDSFVLAKKHLYAGTKSDVLLRNRPEVLSVLRHETGHTIATPRDMRRTRPLTKLWHKDIKAAKGLRDKWAATKKYMSRLGYAEEKKAWKNAIQLSPHARISRPALQLGLGSHAHAKQIDQTQYKKDLRALLRYQRYVRHVRKRTGVNTPDFAVSRPYTRKELRDNLERQLRKEQRNYVRKDFPRHKKMARLLRRKLTARWRNK